MAADINSPATGPDFAAAAKDAVLAGIIALGVFGPLVGFRTDQDMNNRLIVENRWGLVAIIVAIVVVGRFLLKAFVFPALAAGKGRPKAAAGEPSFLKRNIKSIGLVFLLFYPVIIVSMLGFQSSIKWVDNFGIQILIYVMLGWGLNIVVGLAGLLDLGYVAFYAVGAYSYALLAHYFGLSFWLCLPLAGVLAAMSGVLLGFPVLRLRGDYFAIVTLGFGEIIRIILVNWYQFTGGPNGISGIPRPSFFGIADFVRTPPEGTLAFHELFGLEFSALHRIVFLYYLILVLALVVNVFTLRIRKLPLGRAWEALREDDIACASLGINRTNMKLAAFAIAAMFGGFAGSFFATRQGFISPESFTFIESAIILAIVVLGGMGSQIGVVVATLLVIGLPEAFRELADYRMLAFGMGMVVIMLWRPRGLLAHRDPTILLFGRKKDSSGGPAGGTAAAGGEGIAGGRAK